MQYKVVIHDCIDYNSKSEQNTVINAHADVIQNLWKVITCTSVWTKFMIQFRYLKNNCRKIWDLMGHKKSFKKMMVKA